MPVLETDAAGAAAMRAAGLDALYVFFAHPADADEHRRNLVAAGESEDVLDERAEEAAAELEAARGEVRLEDGGEAVPLYDVVLEYEDRKPRFARFKEAIATREPRTVPMSAAWGFGRPRWDLTARVRSPATSRRRGRTRGVRKINRGARTRGKVRRAVGVSRRAASRGGVR